MTEQEKIQTQISSCVQAQETLQGEIDKLEEQLKAAKKPLRFGEIVTLDVHPRTERIWLRNKKGRPCPYDCDGNDIQSFNESIYSRTGRTIFDLIK